MKKTELDNCPKWLLEASTEDEDVTIDGSIVNWHDGIWHDGAWRCGVWNRGTVRGVSVSMIGTFTFCDGYHKTLFSVYGVAWILAGCRWFTLADAKKHWGGRKDRVFTRASLHSAVALAKHFGLKEE